MSCDIADDYALALRLQKEWQDEENATTDTEIGYSDLFLTNPNQCSDAALASKLHSQWNGHDSNTDLNSSLSIVDERWELIDPNPDIRALFLQFNEQFFWGRLASCEVRWSPRMTLCAGLCCYEGRGGLCSMRLSMPLLKLRPRKDLVETLLHEMIHAYLFVTDNNKDHDGHGPEFCKHMSRINTETGTKISIYHSFHDEVNNYRQHWWRCNGPCQQRKPYFGYVKRAMNRAPGPNDTWWADHQRSCGGTYTKIKEPENYGKKNKSKENVKKNKEEMNKGTKLNIGKFFGGGTAQVESRSGQSSSQGSSSQSVGGKNKKDAIVITPDDFNEVNKANETAKPNSDLDIPKVSDKGQGLDPDPDPEGHRKEVINARKKFLDRLEEDKTRFWPPSKRLKKESVSRGMLGQLKIDNIFKKTPEKDIKTATTAKDDGQSFRVETPSLSLHDNTPSLSLHDKTLHDKTPSQSLHDKTPSQSLHDKITSDVSQFFTAELTRRSELPRQPNDVVDLTDDDDDTVRLRQTQTCPVCHSHISASDMNNHLDMCLN